MMVTPHVLVINERPAVDFAVAYSGLFNFFGYGVEFKRKQWNRAAAFDDLGSFGNLTFIVCNARKPYFRIEDWIGNSGIPTLPSVQSDISGSASVVLEGKR